MAGLRPALLALALCLLSGPARADDRALLDRAIAQATGQFEAALPALGSTLFDVDIAAYRAALEQGSFTGGAWQGRTRLAMEIRAKNSGSCRQFAAFVRIPPEDGAVGFVLCPQFFDPGADALRALTILHEMVHAVAGRDECQAMAFAAHVEQLATGRFTPVNAYWAASNCAGSPYRLP
tara:strand:- start:1703 stop:2239 length:537 start_codon:yes stop_codon:yes gene_type:complete